MSNKSKHHIPNQQQKNPHPKQNNHGLIAHHEQYTGPIPNAVELQRYEDIEPGFAGRILTMAEKEQVARHELNTTSSNKVFEIEQNKISITKRGQWFALFIVLFVLLLAGYISYLGNTNAAAGLVGAVIVGIILAFVGGNKKDIKS